MEAIDAERDDGFGLRQRADPVIQAFRIAPDGSLHDILRLGGVVLRAGIDDLDRRSRLQHRPDFLDGYRRRVGELRLFESTGWRDLDRILIAQLYRGPV